ncbi:zinc finger protein on ecdysone puffs isoform X2 [Trichoplusia ni]|uniref:Zinc finger protein on ecdysone puffs isoform X2 n=1 Tax=Trichoplusia ni TaxID=7111 RepID=A0A7E5VLK7_TRINI|nr:zinc finger protein on ecdysone puffs isoform X2 [Trichoplusia ni]
MANRRPQNGNGRRMDFQRNDRGKNFGRSGVSPWQGGGPGGGLPNLLPLSGGSTEATLALASNIINLLQPRQNPVPSLLDMPIRRDFGPNMGRYDRGYGPNRMGNQGNFRRTGTYNRSGERINNNRKPYRPNDGQRQQNKSSPKKEADSKAKPVKESETNEGTEGEAQDQQDKDKDEEVKKEAPKTRYDDINPQLLKCHICNKSMWDGRSFENHLSGRAHAIMMTKTAESYALTADTMRQEFKIREMKRTRKAGQQPARDFYCAMCDMYAADGAIHRTTVGHRKLKKYLHPTCTSCHKEMPTRIELDEHRLTAEHLKNMQDKQEIITKPKPEVMVISTLNMEQLYLREDRQRRRRNDDKKDDDKDADDAEVKEEKTDNQEDAIKKEKDNADIKPDVEPKKLDSIDSENTVLDYNEGDDVSKLTQDMFPAYSTERGVGQSFLSEFRCVQCRLCRKLLDCPATAQVHLRTWRHHQLFTRLLAEKSGTQLPHPDSGKLNSDSGKRPLNAEDSSEAKRRKIDDAQEAEQNGHEEGKEEPLDSAAEDAILAKDDDVEMSAADELDNWEQTVDEILDDEKAADEAEQKKTEEAAKAAEEEKSKAAEPVQPAKPQEPEKPKTPTPTVVAGVDDKPRNSPRGRGRPRARGRGRY